ncbi:hypothetical protein NF27_FN00100 [Candidatus Jidaibacter acanthamoeba]|uniref:Aminoglycoside phosphotransferase domain-containing protein n=1 Tax=Candidatus Jidaibacter acanthamoebae TaxID=86105 RepID=A0A0C1MY49_9RICK|nr:phosphotransferase [Candidatus Jidaibacter acanthamoeba]KIE04861.1 hypothetical protein NF27_FN00100 [Candidatus Jidaibacter acanthamoeba]
MPFTHQITKVENHIIDDIDFCIKLEEFLHDYGIKTYKLIKIDTDASKRHYYRIITLEKSYILMDSSQEPESVTPFLNVANLLIKHEIKAPVVYAENLEQGLLLLEDLGNDSYTKFIDNSSEQEQLLYSHAIDVLIKIAKAEVDISLPLQDEKLLNAGVLIFNEFYIHHKLEPKAAINASKEILNTFSELYKLLKNYKLVLTLRDYHADNLMWIKHNNTTHKVGVLDFQDAVLGLPGYDLVSLLEDARRDVSPKVVESCKAQYFSSFQNMKHSDLELIYAILGAQRNLRIVGAFHRLNIKYNKYKYLKYLPRVWQHIKNNLEHPTLEPLKEIFEKYKLYEF